jgi:hypothetical protein
MSLRDVWRKEVNGIAKRYIRSFEAVGMGDYAVADSIAHGADIEACAEALGYRDGEPPEGLVKLATAADLDALLAGRSGSEGER